MSSDNDATRATDGETEADRPRPVGVATERHAIAERYELRGMLGAGGMGTVFAAYDRDLGDIVALKLLRSTSAEHDPMLELFRQEVRLARRVTHPNVARVFDIGVAQNFAFLTMELIDGVALSSLATAPLDPGRVIEIGLQLCEALTAAHDAGVLHCDLKPANVLCARDGRYVVTDFGIARALRMSSATPSEGSRETVVIGTPPFMSPEQMAGDELDERTDIYALGVLLFRLLAGKLPWTETTRNELHIARLTGPVPDLRAIMPDVPAPLAELAKRCLAVRRTDRVASARHVAEALRAAVVAVGHRAVAPPRERVPIAVLPIEADDADASLAAGLVDEIGEHLAASAELVVKPRALVERVRKTTNGAPALARSLRVDHVVTGELSRTSDRLHIELRLVSVSEWKTALALNLDFGADDVLSVAQRVARHVALALEAPIAPAARANGAAADLFLRGRAMYRAFEDGTSLLARAHELSPDDARIAATYALALARRESATDSLSHARAVADRAVELDPNLSDARLAVALMHLYDGEGRASAIALRRAYALEPSNLDVLSWMGRLLIEVGALKLGVERLERALALSPGMPVAAEARSRGLALLGRYNEAIAALQEAREGLGPIHAYVLSRMHVWHPTEAVEAELVAAASAASLPPEGRDFLLTAVAIGRGEPVSDEVLLRQLVRFRATGSPRRIAFDVQRRVELLAATRRFEEASAVLAQLDDHSFIDLAWIDGCPLLAPLRGSPPLAHVRRATAVRAARVRDALTG